MPTVHEFDARADANGIVHNCIGRIIVGDVDTRRASTSCSLPASKL